MAAAARTRWGIVSAGRLSHDFCIVLRSLPEEHQITAIAARELKRAKEYATKFDIPKSYGSYEELALDSNIDVVYIANWHPFHKDTCKMMMRAGKHVLCEKPLAVNTKDAKEVIEFAKERGVLLVEGYWSKHFPVYHQLRREIQEGSIGDVRFITVNHGLNLVHNEKYYSDPDMPCGAIFELGCYNIMFATMVYGEKPEKIVASGILNEAGHDMFDSVTLYYSGSRVAQLNMSVNQAYSNGAELNGTKGTIKMLEVINPTELITPRKKYEFPLPNTVMPLQGRREGFVYEAQCIRQCILNGEKECPLVTHQDTITIMEIMDEVRRQVGHKTL